VIIAVDFDETVWTRGAEVPGAISSLKALKARGHTMMLFTNRTGPLLSFATTWLKQQGFEFDMINSDLAWWQKLFVSSSKPYADKFVDDRNVGCPVILFMGVQCVDWKATLDQLAA